MQLQLAHLVLQQVFDHGCRMSCPSMMLQYSGADVCRTGVMTNGDGDMSVKMDSLPSRFFLVVS